jgi:hypothetical protein
MARLIERLWGRKDEQAERETPPARDREVRRGPFAAGWVSNDGELHAEPPPPFVGRTAPSAKNRTRR